MADQTVALELRGDADSLIAAVNESGEAMDALAGQASDTAEEIEQSVSGSAAAFDKYGTAIGAAITGAGAALEGFNRSQQDTRFVAARAGNAIGESTDAIVGLAVEVHDATRDLGEMVEMMETGAQQGLTSGQALQDYAVFWDTVGDATGESAGSLADASVALRAVGIAAGQEGQALDAFGFIAQETTGSVGEFLKFLERTGPELGDMGINIDQAAALLGILEQEFGMSGRTARQEFRSAVGESDGTLGGLLETLGVGEETFAAYTDQVAASSDVIADNAAAFKESRTTMQELQAWLDATMLKFSGVGEAVEIASGPLMAAGGLIVGLNQLKQLSPGLVASLGRVAVGLGAIGGAVGALFLVKQGLDALGLSAQGLQIDIETTARSTTEELVASFLELERALGAGESMALFGEVASRNIGIAERLRDGLADVGYETGELDTVLDDAAAAERRLAEDSNRATEILSENAGTIEDEAVEPYENLEAAIRGVNDALHAQFDPLFAAQDALLANADAQEDVRRAELELLKAQDDLNTAIGEHGPKSKEATDATYGLMAAEDRLTRANRDASRSALDVTTSLNTLIGKLVDGSVSLEDSEAQLRTWVDQGLITEAQARDMAAELQQVADKADQAASKDVIIQARLEGFRQIIADLDELARRAGTPLIFTSTIRGREAAADREHGGWVPGAMGEMVPINAHGGEYVIRAEAAQAIGPGRLDALNRADRLPASFTPSLSSPAMSGGGNTYAWQPTIFTRTPQEVADESHAAHRRIQLGTM